MKADRKQPICILCREPVTAKEVSVDKDGNAIEPRFELFNMDGTRHFCEVAK